MDEILRVCTHVKILATSRELLGVVGEATWRVGSLSVPTGDTLAGVQDGLPQAVLASESGRLFAFVWLRLWQACLQHEHDSLDASPNGHRLLPEALTMMYHR